MSTDRERYLADRYDYLPVADREAHAQKVEHGIKEITEKTRAEELGVRVAFELRAEAMHALTVEQKKAWVDAQCAQYWVDKARSVFGTFMSGFEEQQDVDVRIAEPAVREETKTHAYIEFYPKGYRDSEDEGDDTEAADSETLFEGGFRRITGIKRMGAFEAIPPCDNAKFAFSDLAAIKAYYAERYEAERLVPIVYKYRFTYPVSFCQFVFICRDASHARKIATALRKQPEDIDGIFQFKHAWLADQFTGQ